MVVPYNFILYNTILPYHYAYLLVYFPTVMSPDSSFNSPIKMNSSKVTLENAECYHLWFAKVQSNLEEDLWHYFDPNDGHEKWMKDIPRTAVGLILAARSAHGDFEAYHTRFGHDDAEFRNGMPPVRRPQNPDGPLDLQV